MRRGIMFERKRELWGELASQCFHNVLPIVYGGNPLFTRLN